MKKIKEFLINVLALLFGIEVNTIAADAYKKLKDIPEDEWIVAAFTNGVDKCCALGHYGRLATADPSNYSRPNIRTEKSDAAINKLVDYTTRYMAVKGIRNLAVCELPSIGTVNDLSLIGPYIESSPKVRVLKLLKDMVKDGW